MGLAFWQTQENAEYFQDIELLNSAPSFTTSGLFFANYYEDEVLLREAPMPEYPLADTELGVESHSNLDRSLRMRNNGPVAVTCTVYRFEGGVWVEDSATSVPNDNVLTTARTANYDAVNKGYVDDAIAGVSADVDLGASSTATTTTITNTAGSGAVISAATTSAAGVMSGADKAKLNGIESGATANQSDAYLLSRSNHTGTQAISTISGLQTALDGKEPAFSKNTAFNKNFGTAAGTVSEGNHTHPASDIASGTLAVARIPDLPAAQITSGTFSTSRIPTLSISKVSGLQSALDAKANLSGATFTGNVTAPEFFRTSTIKVKKDIKPFEESALGILSGVDVVSYYLKKGPQYKRIGFIAEDTHEYLSTPSHNVMDYGSSIGVLIKAVQELEARVKELEGRLAECQE